MKYFKIISFFIYFLTSYSYSQVLPNIESVKINIDKKEYDIALNSLELLIKENPQNNDYILYKGLIYSWQKEYTKAIEILKPLTVKPVSNTEAQEALINTYFWAAMYQECINEIDQYLLEKSNSDSILIKKAICLEKLNQDDAAIKILNSLTTKENTEAIEALRTTIYKKNKNLISISYLNASFYDPSDSPWHLGYIEYARQFEKFSIIGRITNGIIFNKNERKYEVDVYHTITNKSYLYLTGGISDGSTIFPKYNTAVEYFFEPIKKLNYSFGLRYLDFRIDKVTLLTGQLEYQLKNNYSIKYRPYLEIDNAFLSHVFSLRKTNEIKEQFVQFDLQYGNIPYLYIYNNVTVPLKAYRVGVQYQLRIKNNYFLKPILLYEYEEFLPDTYRNKLNCQLILSKRF